MKKFIRLLACILALCALFTCCASATFESQGALPLNEFMSERVPWYYWNIYLNADTDEYAEAKLDCANEIGYFFDYEDGEYLICHADKRYTIPESNGPEPAGRTLFIEADKEYSSVALFRSKKAEPSEYEYEFTGDYNFIITDDDHYMNWAGWNGSDMTFDMYFRYPGLVFVQAVGSKTGEVANAMIVVK